MGPDFDETAFHDGRLRSVCYNSYLNNLLSKGNFSTFLTLMRLKSP